MQKTRLFHKYLAYFSNHSILIVGIFSVLCRVIGGVFLAFQIFNTFVDGSCFLRARLFRRVALSFQ